MVVTSPYHDTWQVLSAIAREYSYGDAETIVINFSELRDGGMKLVDAYRVVNQLRAKNVVTEYAVAQSPRLSFRLVLNEEHFKKFFNQVRIARESGQILWNTSPTIQLLWESRRQGKVQINGREFQQSGVIMKAIFIRLIDNWQKDGKASVQEVVRSLIKKHKKLTARAARIHIHAINQRLSRDAGVVFSGDGEGYYSLELTDKRT